MRAYDCPQCGGVVEFKSSITIFATCSYCGNMVVRRDMDLESLGNQAALPPDLSPLQIGTTGYFEEQAFVLVGRVRIGYREGTWTEWCADFGEGRWGWIAEAQGFYMASFEMPVPEGFPGSERMAHETRLPDGLTLIGQGLTVGREAMPVGGKVAIDGTEYKVRDVKQTEVLGSEGELSFAAMPGRSAISADLGAPGRRFANAEYSEGGIRLFAGRFCRFEELQFANLRPVPGWTGDQETVRNQSAALSCPACGAAVELRAAGFTKAAVCTHCSSVIDTSNPVWQTLEGAVSRPLLAPRIPIGARGEFRGVLYENIGCMTRTDNFGDRWFEYLLFNPFHGFRWLVNYGGHWTWVTTLLEPPADGGEGLVPDWSQFRTYSAGWAQVGDVIGEFYWKVRRRERTSIEDYILPPRVISCETYPDLAEETWSLGEYIEAGEVWTAFRLAGSPIGPAGVYLNQPNPYQGAWHRLAAPLGVGLAVLTLVQLISLVNASPEPIFRTPIEYDAARTNKTLVTSEFELKRRLAGPLTLRLSAPVQDNWFGADIYLVDAVTQKARGVSSEVAYYSGWDDGAWTEGSQDDEQLLSGVPPGRYFLRIEPAADPKIQHLSAHLAVIPGGAVWSNYLLGLLFVSVVPVYYGIRSAAFEGERWAGSYIPGQRTRPEEIESIHVAEMLDADDD